MVRYNKLSPAEVYRKAINNPKADIKKYQEGACKVPASAYYFAKDIPEANIEYCQKAAGKVPASAYYFAWGIAKANIEYCLEACKNSDWYYHLLKELPQILAKRASEKAEK